VAHGGAENQAQVVHPRPFWPIRLQRDAVRIFVLESCECGRRGVRWIFRAQSEGKDQEVLLGVHQRAGPKQNAAKIGRKKVATAARAVQDQDGGDRWPFASLPAFPGCNSAYALGALPRLEMEIADDIIDFLLFFFFLMARAI